MKLLIVSAAPLVKLDSGFAAYAPYVKELDLMAKFCDDIAFCCPVWNADNGLLIQPIDFHTKVIPLTDSNVTTFSAALHAFGNLFHNMSQIFKAMRAADHIHLRCPGNIGLLACVVQILFPNKKKSAKYAGNWDMKSAQPFSYRMQKWILNNRFLTRNMKVLVYGTWEGASENIVPFFTASYRESEKAAVARRSLTGTIKFIFVGTLSTGKRPLYAIQLVEKLAESCDAVLHIYGDGSQRPEIEDYIMDNGLGDIVHLHGNQDKKTLSEAYSDTHFIILASKSEGWPKAVAEAMFWGCVPLVTNISCVPEMIGNGSRGILLNLDKEHDVTAVREVLRNEVKYHSMSDKALDWSQQYTIERFETELKKIIEC